MKHSSEFENLAADAKGRIKELSVAETQERLREGAALIDVREDGEWQAGHAAGASPWAGV